MLVNKTLYPLQTPFSNFHTFDEIDSNISFGLYYGKFDPHAIQSALSSEYSLVDNRLYQLVFGVIDKDGKINFKIRQRHIDLKRSMSTVISSIDIFLSKNPKRLVEFSGNDLRNALYSKIVKRMCEEHGSKEIFNIWAFDSEKGYVKDFKLDSGSTYESFIIQKK